MNSVDNYAIFFGLGSSFGFEGTFGA